MTEITDNLSIFSPPNKRNSTKATVLTALSMYAALGLPWTTAHNLRVALGLPHSLLTLLSRWVAWGYVKRRGESGYYSYRLANTGRLWLRDLHLWWPEIRLGIPVDESQRMAVIDGVRRHVAASSGVTAWWGRSMGRDYVVDIRALKGPFLGTGDYVTHRGRVAINELRYLFDTDYLVRVDDAMSAVGIVGDTLGMASGRAMIEAMVSAGQLEWA